jgi:transposase-like protein
MGRLSNPPETLEHLAEQGCHGSPTTSRETRKSPKRSSDSPGPRDSNNKGQLSNPTSMALCGDDYGAHPATAGRSTRRPGPAVQRRLTPSQLQALAARYQSGRSLHDLAREFGVHHRTVADHLERLGIARRVNLPKLSAADVKRAATRCRAGESLAIMGKALNVDASTVGRALKRAGIKIRPRPGTERR